MFHICQNHLALVLMNLVVFTEIMGKTYSNAADSDRANLDYQ